MKKSWNFPKLCFHSISDKRKNLIDTKIKMPFLEIRFRQYIEYILLQNKSMTVFYSCRNITNWFSVKVLSFFCSIVRELLNCAEWLYCDDSPEDK